MAAGRTFGASCERFGGRAGFDGVLCAVSLVSGILIEQNQLVRGFMGREGDMGGGHGLGK